MKTKLYPLLLSVVITIGCIIPAQKLQAQTSVLIPDTNFVAWLNANGYSGCMNGNLMDTTCAAVVNADSVECSNVGIYDLTGVQYFHNLRYLDCGRNALVGLPSPLPVSLTTLIVDYNDITSLPTLPDSLNYLTCDSNYISVLPTLPLALNWLSVRYNQLTILPALPLMLTYLNCGDNQLGNLPILPTALASLLCWNNQFISLPALPAGLGGLYCMGNLLTSLPVLPSGLYVLDISNNQFTISPTLPSTLNQFSCSTNHLTSLPALPHNLGFLFCDYNQLTTLPPLPSTLTGIGCSHNQLTNLPALPNNLNFLNCNDNPYLTCLPLLTQISDLNFSNTPVACIPNYGTIGNSNPLLSTLPLCIVNNPFGCASFLNITGKVYYDANSNCFFDSTDAGLKNVKVSLYDDTVLQQQIFTGSEGFYSFDVNNAYGNYTVRLDTLQPLFSFNCPSSGIDSAIISATDSFYSGKDFALICKAGFDVGIFNIINCQVPRPASQITVNITAGDISQLFGAHCAAGITGQVQVVFNGPITFLGVNSGSLVPNVNNDTLIWNITDFGTLNADSAFNLLFQVNSNAIAGTSICLTVTVTPTTGDSNLSNNNSSYCFDVVNALDPNEKEVYPSGAIDTSQQWLTYTIRFQNTGTASAQHIYILDWLNTNLDASSVQMLASSHDNCIVQVLQGGLLKFDFPTINLPDSATSDKLSRGYVQFRVKRKDNLGIGTQISNIAHIYFDLNPAVVTNTVTNIISNISSISPIVTGELEINLYPNPAKEYVMVATGKNTTGSSLQLSDIQGRQILSANLASTNYRLETGHLSAGLYLVKVTDLNGRVGVRKLVIE